MRIWLGVTVERVETATFNPRVENRSFNPLYRYRKSDFQRRRYEKSIPWPSSRKKIMCDTWKTLILLVWLLPLLCSGINLHTRKINIFFPNCIIYYFTLQSTLVTIQTSVKKVHIFRTCKKIAKSPFLTASYKIF